MKKYIIMILFIMVGLVLTGCADVTFEVETDATTGSITQSVIVKPNYELLNEKGYTRDTVNERIITTYKKIVQTQEDNFKNYHIFSTNSVKEEFLKKIKHNHKIDEENNQVILQNIFSSYSDYVNYYCITIEDLKNDDSEENKNLLYTISETKTKSVFNSLENSSITKYVENMFSYNGKNDFTYKDLTYHYSYATKDSKQKSNADKIIYQNNFYRHIWNFDKDNLDKEISFTKVTKIYVVNWYYLSLIMAFCLFMILMIINECVQMHKLEVQRSNYE